jgi:hypothetical protein
MTLIYIVLMVLYEHVWVSEPIGAAHPLGNRPVDL